jgi:hypothetical protein
MSAPLTARSEIAMLALPWSTFEASSLPVLLASLPASQVAARHHAYRPLPVTKPFGMIEINRRSPLGVVSDWVNLLFLWTSLACRRRRTTLFGYADVSRQARVPARLASACARKRSRKSEHDCRPFQCVQGLPRVGQAGNVHPKSSHDGIAVNCARALQALSEHVAVCRIEVGQHHPYGGIRYHGVSLSSSCSFERLRLRRSPQSVLSFPWEPRGF